MFPVRRGGRRLGRACCRRWVLVLPPLARGSMHSRKDSEGAVMADAQPDIQPSRLTMVSNALVALHKEQFGRGPTGARSNFAGPDALLCVLEDALLPAERAMVEMGEHQRVRESRMFFQVATADQFVAVVERITGRTVRAFASATDPAQSVVMENFVFEPDGARGSPAAPVA